MVLDGRLLLTGFACMVLGFILCSWLKGCTGTSPCPEPGSILSERIDTIWMDKPVVTKYNTKPRLIAVKPHSQAKDSAAAFSNSPCDTLIACADTNIFQNTICGKDYSIDIFDTIAFNRILGTGTIFTDNRPSIVKTIQLAPKERFKFYVGAMLGARAKQPQSVAAGPSFLATYKRGGLAYTWDGVSNSHHVSGYYLISFRKK